MPQYSIVRFVRKQVGWFVRQLPFTQYSCGLEVFANSRTRKPRTFASDSWMTILISMFVLFITLQTFESKIGRVGKSIKSEFGFSPTNSFNETFEVNHNYYEIRPIVTEFKIKSFSARNTSLIIRELGADFTSPEEYKQSFFPEL